MIRIGLADDEPLFTTGLAMLLGAQQDMEVVWKAVDGADAVRLQTRSPADVLLLDVQMPVMNGLEATRRLVSSGTEARIVILTTFDTDGYVLGAIDAGAAGFLLKNTAPEELVDAVRTVSSGDSIVSPGPTRRLLTAVRGNQAPLAQQQPGQADDPAAAGDMGGLGLHGLTERETEVLRLIALGLTNQEVCDRLWLSMATVKTHVSHLLTKTGARDRVQLVLLALRGGVVDLSEVLSG